MDVYAVVVSLIAGALAAEMVAQRARRFWERRIRLEQESAESRRMADVQRIIATTLSEALVPYRTQPVDGPAQRERKAPSNAEGAFSDGQVIAELAHSLRTPLLAARHEADAIALSHAGRPDLVEQARNIEGFVDLCDTVLATFRQLVDTARRTERLRSGPLDQVVERLHAAVESEHKRGTTLIALSLPTAIPGYLNGYLATLLLPLVENAVEASPAAGQIRVKYDEDPEYSFLTITNTIADVPDGPVFPADGVSAKHDGPGFGLSVARRLADMRRGGRVETDASGEVARVRVRLPKELRA
jgi:signal transduction histidine kinase